MKEKASKKQKNAGRHRARLEEEGDQPFFWRCFDQVRLRLLPGSFRRCRMPACQFLRSLKILQQQQKPGLLKGTLAGVGGDVESGSTLSEAMSKHPKAFDRLYVNMVQAGETGGVLDVILQRLAEFMEKAQKLKRRVVGAMSYPSVVICFSILQSSRAS